MLRVGCSGFPINQEQYFKTFPAVELNSTFYNLPRLATAEGWRAKAPPGFTFAVKAWQLVTHDPGSPTYDKLTRPIPKNRAAWYGLFKDTAEVTEAWEKTREVAEAVKASFILFQTPPNFYFNQDHAGNLKRFFKRIRRGEWLLAWEPRGDWEPGMVKRLCEELDLLHAVDPLKEPSQRGRVKYYRMHGAYLGRRIDYNHAYTDAEILKLVGLVEGQDAYVFFNNRAMLDDARRFQARALSPLRLAPKGTIFGPGVRPYRGGLA